MRKNRIKIGLDFHGVINANPEFFSNFTHLAVDEGDEIHVITGGPAHIIKKLLDEWNIAYTTIFAILDFYEVLDKVQYFADGEFHVDDKLWNSAKANYCKEHCINIHIDDSSIFKQWFSTPYCLFDEKAQDCVLGNGVKIDLSQGAAVALAEIRRYVDSEQEDKTLMPYHCRRNPDKP